MTGQDLRTLIEAPHRRPANISRNAARHPVETLEFFGLAPDLTVLEILPAFGWYTEILAPYLANEGLLYVAHFSPDGILPYMPKALEMYEKIARRNPEIYGKVTVRHINPPNEVSVAPPESVDLAMTFRNVHNWIMSDQEDEYFNAFYQAVKPGGVLGVVEHRARPGASMETMHKTGYVTEDYVKEVAVKAGFEFEGASDINANPKDTTDHPNGVWSLPPILQSGEDDRFRAIGESDRMTLKFRKPN